MYFEEIGQRMTNVIFTGVGGQGVILAAKILMDVALRNAFDVKESEIHGMAQRGGSVDCHVRFGPKVHSPLVKRGTAHYIVAFELLEGVRKLEYLSPDGLLIIDQGRIDPAPVRNGLTAYPPDLEDWIRTHVSPHFIVNTREDLERLRFKKALNIMMLGVLSRHLDFEESLWKDSIRSLVKSSTLDLNLEVFARGRSLQAINA
jgi:indolepyruvate ferredoxin oxidoreductase beta subunit